MDDWKKGKFVAAQQMGKTSYCWQLHVCVLNILMIKFQLEMKKQRKKMNAFLWPLVWLYHLHFHRTNLKRMKWFVLSNHMYICGLFYYKQEDISTGTVGHKSLTISSIVSFDLMELRVSNTWSNHSLFIIYCETGSSTV